MSDIVNYVQTDSIHKKIYSIYQIYGLHTWSGSSIFFAAVLVPPVVLLWCSSWEIMHELVQDHKPTADRRSYMTRIPWPVRTPWSFCSPRDLDHLRLICGAAAVSYSGPVCRDHRRRPLGLCHGGHDELGDEAAVEAAAGGGRMLRGCHRVERVCCGTRLDQGCWVGGYKDAAPRNSRKEAVSPQRHDRIYRHYSLRKRDVNKRSTI